MTRLFRDLSLTAALALVAGCSSSSTKLSLSARSGTAAATAAAPGRTARLAAGGGVNLTRVRMVIEEIKLEPAGDAGSSSDGGSDGGTQGEDVLLGPYLLDMSGAALESGLTQVFDADAVPGTYKEIRFKIHKLSGGDPQFTDMANLSIKLEGTNAAGQAFTWTSTLDEEQRHEGTFVIADGSSNNITLAIDTSRWFLDRNGRPIDPIVAQTDGSTRSIVEDNIKSSIDAFDDDNHDGRHD